MKIINYRKMYTCHVKNLLLANNCRKLLIKVGIYLIFFSIAVLIALIPNILSSKKHVGSNRYHHVRFTTDIKYILFWKLPKKNKKNFYNKDLEYLPGQAQFINQNCPHINCYITYNKTLLRTEDNFDAIVFNIHDIKKLNPNNLNLRRSSNQIYILKSHESSEHHPICNPFFDDFFNWTWTYKLNSDIPHPFINIHDSKNNLFGPSKTLNWISDMTHTDKYKRNITGKKKAVAWLITNCKLKNKHQEFVIDLKQELRGYNYNVDSFGPCGENKCPKGGIAKCFEMINREYFFNLVLEDSFADDYVTEKMSKGMTYLFVPIVNGMTNYSNFLPPGSYINAHSFDLKKLGAVIDYLIKNPEKYSYFFDWKSYYFYTTRPRSYLCDLCAKLNEDTETKSYRELRRWWNPDFEDTCQRVHLYNLFRDTKDDKV